MRNEGRTESSYLISPYSFLSIMKKREIQELKNMSAAELAKRLREGRERLRALQFDLAAGKVKNVGVLRELRKDIARYATFITKANRQ